jgi:5-methylcytosine-specific restriction protein A
LAAGRTVIATDVDHLERHDGTNDPRFWDWANLDSKCHACHSQKTAREDSTFANRR